MSVGTDTMSQPMRRLSLLAVIVSLTGACTQLPVAATPAPVPVDTLFYISARARDAGVDTDRLAEALEYGLVITRRVPDADPLTERLPFTVEDTLLLARAEFVAMLRARTEAAEPGDGFAVLYTHGYGTSLHNAWEHSTTSRARARSTQPWVVFAWPTIGSGVTWPKNGHFLASAYRQDAAMAVASRGAFAEAFEAVHEAVGGDGLLMVAHSLGGQLVGGTLAEDAGLRARLGADPLRALAFVSPDIEATQFGDELVPLLRPLTQRLLLYASADDRVLSLSQMLNDSQRAGRIERDADGPLVRDGLESVDITDGVFANSRLVHLFGTRHALRRKSAALFDLVHVVGARRAAACRGAVGTAVQLVSGAWRLTGVPLPAPPAVARCGRES
jgi:esterase/lipase superfamily enzyme